MKKKKQAGRLTALVLLCVFLSAAAAGCGKNTKENPQQTGTEQGSETGIAGGESGQGQVLSGADGKDGEEEVKDPVQAQREELANDLLVDEDGNPLSPEDIAAMDGDVSDGMPSPMEEFDSAQDLAGATNLPIEEITELPFEPSRTLYLVYDNGMYEIQYEEESGNQVSFRKGEGTGDVSGLTGLGFYDGEESVRAGDLDLTVYSVEDQVLLATWTDGTYAYSIAVDAGTTAEGMAKMAESVR